MGEFQTIIVHEYQLGSLNGKVKSQSRHYNNIANWSFWIWI